MPRTGQYRQRGRKRAIASDRLDFVRMHLTIGPHHTGVPAIDIVDPISDEELIEGWREHGPTILKSCKKRDSDRRPWGWWHFDHAELRRKQIADCPYEIPESRDQRFWFGIPELFCVDCVLLRCSDIHSDADGLVMTAGDIHRHVMAYVECFEPQSAVIE